MTHLTRERERIIKAIVNASYARINSRLRAELVNEYPIACLIEHGPELLADKWSWYVAEN